MIWIWRSDDPDPMILNVVGLQDCQNRRFWWKWLKIVFLKKVTVFDFSHFLHFRRKFEIGGVFSKNLTLFFAFFVKSAFFDHFCKNRRIRQNTCFCHFWPFWEKVTFLTILTNLEPNDISDPLVLRTRSSRSSDLRIHIIKSSDLKSCISYYSVFSKDGN